MLLERDRFLERTSSTPMPTRLDPVTMFHGPAVSRIAQSGNVTGVAAASSIPTSLASRCACPSACSADREVVLLPDIEELSLSSGAAAIDRAATNLARI